MRVRSSGLLIVTALLGVSAVAPAVGDAAVARRCGGLTGRKVIETATVRIVSRPSHTYPSVPKGTTGTEFVGRAFYGCVLPRGRVRRVGETGKYYFYTPGERPARSGIGGAGSASFSRPTGRYVLAHISGGSLTTSSDAGSVIDMATGKDYTYWSFEEYDGSNQATGPLSDSAPPEAVRLSRRGVLAGVYASDAGDGTTVHTVEAFLPNGDRKALDQAPAGAIVPASLRLSGDVVSWTNAEQVKSVTVTAATPARDPSTLPENCSQDLPGTPLPSTDRFKLLSRPHQNEGVDFTDYYVCERPDGPLTFLASARANPEVSGAASISFPALAGDYFIIRKVNEYPGYVDEQTGLTEPPSRQGRDELYTATEPTQRRDVYSRFEKQPAGGYAGPLSMPLVDLLDASGRNVILFDSPSGAKRTLRTGTVPGGKVLDTGTPADIPSGSVQLSAGKVTWTHAGAPRSAPALR